MRKLFLILLLAGVPAFSAFNATAVWEIRSTGADTNGGAFDPGVASPGTDQSQSGGQAYTDIVIGSTTTQATSAAHAFSATTNGPGNFIHIASGTGCTVQWVEMLSQSGGTATFDKSLGTAASTCTGQLGNPLATLGQANTNVVAGNTVYIKATATYTTSSSISLTTAGSSGLPINYIGYTTSRGDNGQITIQASSTNLNILSGVGSYVGIFNMILDCNSQTTTRGLSLQNTFNVVSNLLVKNCTTNGIHMGGNNGQLVNSRVTACTSGCSSGAILADGTNNTLDGVLADGNASPGISASSGLVAINTISNGNTGASSDGFQSSGAASSQMLILRNCASYNNGRDGLRITSAGGVDMLQIRNSVFVNNAGWGINSQVTNWSGTTLLNIDYNGYFGNGSGARGSLPTGAHDVALTGDPFVAAGSNNFALNGTAGAGAALQAAGWPGVLQVGGTGYGDIGPLQHQCSAGGGQHACAAAQ